MKVKKWLKRAGTVMALFFLSGFQLYAIESGYSKGFYLKTDDEKFSMKIKLRGQIQGLSEWKDWHHESSGFIIKRARVYFTGNALSKDLKYEVQITLEGKSISLRDLSVEYPLLKNWLKIEAGQYKVPYNREYLTSSSNLELVDRSIVNEYFYVGRDIGVSINGGDPQGYFAYAVGIFTGEGKNAKPADTGPMIAGRVVAGSKSTWEKGVREMEQGAFKEGFVWSIGAGFVYANYKNIEVLKPYKNIGELKLDNNNKRLDISKFMEALTSIAPPVDFIQVSADLKLSYNSFAVEAEFHTADALKGNIPTWWGFRVQGSSFVYKKKFQLAVRYSTVDTRVGKIKETTWGWSWYISENHRFKLQNDYAYTWGDKNVMDKNEFRGRIQFQFYL